MPASRKGPSFTALFSASRAVNDNLLNRYLVLLAIKVLKNIRPRKGTVLMLTGGLCVKYGRRVHLSEASTMRFISQHTSIPVPKVLCAFSRSGSTYIVMERIKGDIIGNGWVKRSESSKEKLLLQLAKMICDMRELQSPQNIGFASVDGGSLFDFRMEYESGLDPEVQELFEHQNNKSWPLVFTHGDLSSLNILVRGDNIVGIIDWETAGWYPSYWEYTSAYQVNPQNSFWINEIDKFLQPMPEELAMERVRQKYFGDI
ncbi:kinase-like protein [Aspergillus floccosus]